MLNGSCLNCKERCVGCHTNCEHYKKYKQKLAKIKQEKLKERELYKTIKKR